MSASAELTQPTQGLLARWLALYAAVLIAGIAFLRYFALSTALPMNLDRAVFWGVNALTCTGFRLSTNGLQDFSAAGLIGVQILSALGAVFSMTIGGILVCRIAGLCHSAGRVTIAAITLLIGGSLIGAVALFSPARGPAASLFESMTAVTCSGLTLSPYRAIGDPRLQIVVLPMAAIAALGIPVLLDLYDRIRHTRPLSTYTTWVLHVYVLAWLISFAFLLIMNAELPWRENVLTSWTCAANARTAGIDLNLSLPRQIWAVMAVLMLVGAPLGGSGGGLRLMPISTIWRASALGDQPHRHQFAAALPGAAGGLMLFGVCYLFLALSLMTAEPQATTDRLFVLAAGGISNTGLSDDALSLSARGLLVLSVGMLAGHLLPLYFASWIVPAEITLDEP